MTSKRRAFPIAVLGAILAGAVLLLPDRAEAAFGTYCDASASAFVHRMGGTFNQLVVVGSSLASGACASAPNTALDGEVRINAATSAGPAVHTFAQTGAANASGHAGVGSLGATVSVDAGSTPMSYFYTGSDNLTTYATDNNYQASASGHAMAQFWDTLSIVPAPGASPLDRVDVRFTLALSGGRSVSGNGWVLADSSLAITQAVGGGGTLRRSEGGTTSVVLSLYPNTPFTPYTVSLYGILDVSANASAGRALGCVTPGTIWCTTDPAQFGDYYAESRAVGSFGSTAAYYVEVLTPGASFSAASGASYLFAPVPVPAAAWLFGSGMLGLIGAARRHAGVADPLKPS